MNKCFHCGKGLIFGRSHTHHRGVAGGRWKKRAPKTQRIFQPNLQPVHIMVEGAKLKRTRLAEVQTKRVKLCTKCIKRIKKDMAEGVKPFLTLAKDQPKEKAVVETEKTKAKAVGKKTPKTAKTAKK